MFKNIIELPKKKCAKKSLNHPKNKKIDAGASHS